MRCKYCDIDIVGGGIVCPLCHEKLDAESQVEPYAYPQKNKAKHKHTHFTLRKIYIFVSLVLFVISLALSLTLTPTVHWFWLVGLSTIYIYIFIYNTILSSNSISVKIILQAIFIFLTIYATEEIVKKVIDTTAPNNWIWDYALSSIIGLSMIAIIIYTSIKVKKDYSLLIDLNVISLIGYIPIILYATKVIQEPSIAIVCAVLSSIIMIGSIAFGRAELVSEFKKKFHI